MTRWKEVTKEAFYAVMGPRDVQLRSEKMETLWKLPSGQIIGRSTPGYLCRDAEGRYTERKSYHLPA